MVTKYIAKKWHTYYFSGPYRLVDVAAHFKTHRSRLLRAFAHYGLPTKPSGSNRTSGSTPALRAEARRRYEAGDSAEQIAADLGVYPTTIHNWRARYGWRYQRWLNGGEKALILWRLAHGDEQAAIAAELGVTLDAVRLYARKLERGEAIAPLNRPILKERRIGVQDRPKPGDSLLTGWFCSSCTWRGGSAEAWTQHKKHIHEARY